MPAMRRLAPCLLLLCVACTLPSVVDRLEAESPDPALGRPAWVRAPATAGAWLCGALGSAVSIVLLPITWPLAKVADEPLNDDAPQLVWAPVAVGAGAGHFLFGAPFDALDFMFRRAWTDEPAPPVVIPIGDDPPVPPDRADEELR